MAGLFLVSLLILLVITWICICSANDFFLSFLFWMCCIFISFCVSVFSLCIFCWEFESFHVYFWAVCFSWACFCLNRLIRFEFHFILVVLQTISSGVLSSFCMFLGSFCRKLWEFWVIFCMFPVSFCMSLVSFCKSRLSLCWFRFLLLLRISDPTPSVCLSFGLFAVCSF